MLFHKSVALFLCAVSALSSAAAPPLRARLVVDTNTTPRSYGSNPSDFAGSPAGVFFVAQTPESGRELWVSSGSASDTRLAADVRPGPLSSTPSNLRWIGDRLFFDADDGVHSRQLWSYVPATHGLQRLTDLPGYYNADAAVPLASVGELLLFRDTGWQLWLSDGTAINTHALTWPQGYTYVEGSAQTLGNGAIVVLEDSARSYRMLARIDAAGMSLLKAEPSTTFHTSPNNPLPSIVCGSAYYDFHSGRIWRTDGTPEGSTLQGAQLDFYLGKDSPSEAACLNSLVFYTGSHDTFDRPVLYRTDGTSEGTVAVASFGKDFSYEWTIHGLRRFGSHLAFFAPFNDGQSDENETSLWLSDGTTAGTRRIEAHPYAPQSLLPVGDRLAFVGTDGLLTVTENSTTTDLAIPFPLPFVTWPLSSIDGLIYASDGNAPNGEPVVTDATVAGTHQIATIWGGTADGITENRFDADMTAVHNDLLFFIADGIDQSAFTPTLWRTDGNPANTWQIGPSSYGTGAVVQVAEVGNGAAFLARSPDAANAHVFSIGPQSLSAQLVGTASPKNLQSWPSSSGSEALFLCDPGSGQDTLCSLTTTTGTPVSAGGPPGLLGFSRLGSVNGVAIVVVAATDASPYGSSNSLWRTDGTVPGTFLLGNVAPRDSYPTINEYPLAAVLGNELLFPACASSDAMDCALYATNGSSGSLRLVAPMPTGTTFLSLATLPGKVLYSASVDSAFELWSSDGSGAGTLLLSIPGGAGASNLVRIGDRVHFTTQPYQQSPAYWISDGTPIGTHISLDPIPYRPTGALLAFDDSRALFACNGADFGDELCVSDGTPDGTRLVADIFPGPHSSSPSFLGKTSRGVFLIADDGRHGREPWIVESLPEQIFSSGFEK